MIFALISSIGNLFDYMAMLFWSTKRGCDPFADDICNIRPMKLLLGLSITLLLGACGNPAGTACETEGSGFTASHDCKHRCLSRWGVICPDGSSVAPSTCSGSFGCSPGSCPDGQVCYHDVDPFDDRSFCIVSNTCGDLSKPALQEWELTSVARQQEVIEARLEKEARRKKWREENPDNLVTSPADDVPAAKE